jgi:NarL family two-component system response regulator LiaR
VISYTLKTIRATELAELVRKAAQGESILHPSVAVRVIQEIREAKRNVPLAFAERARGPAIGSGGQF